jgi:hypothetical protein
MALAIATPPSTSTSTPPLPLSSTPSLLAAASFVPTPEPRAPGPPPQPPTETAATLALRDARSAAKARSGDPQALATWARAALRAGELREARRAAAAWSLHDGTVEPRLFTAQVLAATGRRSEAIATLNEWLEGHPESVEARSELARIASGESDARAGKPGAARELARR